MTRRLLRAAACCALAYAVAACAEPTGASTTPPADPAEQGLPPCTDTLNAIHAHETGYRGIWYSNEEVTGPYRWKYSGGLGTYPQQIVPMAIYSARARRTFFAYGGDSGGQLTDMVSYYDHATGTVPRPTKVLTRTSTDGHFNPTLSMDAQGYLYVFANAHGNGLEQSPSDSTFAKSYIYRSTCPYSTEAFRRVRSDIFSYSQPWATPQGIVWLHTRYQQYNYRALYVSSSTDGSTWAEPRRLALIQRGDYQVSWAQGSRVGTVFDFHPNATGLNGRTNLYYLESSDLGATWTTVQGAPVTLPVTTPKNPALVRDYQAEGLLVYLKDLKFDEQGHPVILYLTTSTYLPGPSAVPRMWHTARWTGTEWVYRDVAASDHAYDHGSLYLESDGSWRVVAPMDPGPQPYTTGGSMVYLRSTDQGLTWTREMGISPGAMNQTYARGPVNADPGFYAFWADGNTLARSVSHIYFATRDGRSYQLPEQMGETTARPSRAPGTFGFW
ncbi:BNR-4 repeat-containing protein [Longimicrobium sp.]|uniref:BNR-4 repeat-containing protein n=1 Tax=Longimicrobium sp. TaxID=2029185 RepID=UPI002BCD0220|nr:BNR-4 repeat-containing protein [Longimicrobium sp.]HSU13924.1 BNR-4 repeat-containing protein [Longimicrobium sp.]